MNIRNCSKIRQCLIDCSTLSVITICARKRYQVDSLLYILQPINKLYLLLYTITLTNGEKWSQKWSFMSRYSATLQSDIVHGFFTNFSIWLYSCPCCMSTFRLVRIDSRLITKQRCAGRALQAFPTGSLSGRRSN